MYSLMITVEAICFFPSHKDILLLNQYSMNVESSLSHGEGYVIPSLIWPPPYTNTKTDAVGTRLFISSRFGLN